MNRERVDDRRQHAHLISCHTVHDFGRETRTAKDITAANHDRDLHAGSHEFMDFIGDAIQNHRIDPILLLPHQRFAAQLNEHTAVTRRRGMVSTHGELVRCPHLCFDFFGEINGFLFNSFTDFVPDEA